MLSYRVDNSVAFTFQTTSSGAWKAKAKITRSGVFDYLLPDGSIRREFRPEDEVFDQESVESLAMVPLTDRHPPTMIDPETYSQYTVGSIGDTITRDGRWLVGVVQLSAKSVQDKIKEGVVELSAGYFVEYDPTPGVSPDGERYDGVQRSIRYNHVALVPMGRASEGSDKATFKMDARALDLGESSGETGVRADGVKTVKIKINGEKFDVADYVAEAIESERAAVQEKTDGLQAKADAAQEKLDTYDEVVKQAVSERVQLELVAAEHLDSSDLSGMSNRDLRCAVINKLKPSVKLDEASDEYVRVRFDCELELQSEKQTKRVDEAMVDTNVTEPKLDARDKYLQRLRKRGSED